MATLETQYRIFMHENYGNPKSKLSFEEWKELNSNSLKQALIDIMEKDEELGLYEEQLKETTFLMPKVKRVEVIQHSEPYNGRAYTKYNAKDVELQYQDNGYTLKIFLK
jgi:hypothetical protein